MFDGVSDDVPGSGASREWVVEVLLGVRSNMIHNLLCSKLG